MYFWKLLCLRIASKYFWVKEALDLVLNSTKLNPYTNLPKSCSYRSVISELSPRNLHSD